MPKKLHVPTSKSKSQPSPSRSKKQPTKKQPSKSKPTSPNSKSLPSPSTSQSTNCEQSYPSWLRAKPIACEKWLELFAELSKRDQLDLIDYDLLSLYCDCWQQIADADQSIELEGEFFTTDKGYIAIHPAKLKRDKAIDRARKLADRLGIGVASRKGLPKKPQADDQDGLDGFLSGDY